MLMLHSGRYFQQRKFCGGTAGSGRCEIRWMQLGHHFHALLKVCYDCDDIVPLKDWFLNKKITKRKILM